MKTETRAIINYFELSEAWQEEAKSNLDEYAEEASYLEPEEDYDPNVVLWDLENCISNYETSGTVHTANHEGFRYNATIGISNNSAMLLRVSDDGEEAEIIFV